MKKILILAAALVLLAILVVPAAAYAGDTSTVSGEVTSATVSVDVPIGLPFGTFSAGWNVTDWYNAHGWYGTVTVIPGTSGLTSWTVTAQGAAYMTASPTSLTKPLLIGPANGSWSCADGTSSGDVHGVSYSGTCTYTGTDNPHNFDFWAAQYIETGDAANAGSYSDTITFSASCLP
jgi:hypothetical protein